MSPSLRFFGKQFVGSQFVKKWSSYQFARDQFVGYQFVRVGYQFVGYQLSAHYILHKKVATSIYVHFPIHTHIFSLNKRVFSPFNNFFYMKKPIFSFIKIMPSITAGSQLVFTWILILIFSLINPDLLFNSIDP